MPHTLPARVRFAEFELDLKTGELRGGGQTVRLAEKPFRVLSILIERGEELVTREELQKKLWPGDTVVDFEHGINTAIKILRRALGDSADDPRYIETIPRRGYRLMVPVAWIRTGNDEPSSDSLAAGTHIDTAILIGKKVSHYRVLEVIGGGGMGLVFKAEDLKLGRQVALKFLPEELVWDPTALQRFEREARTASSLDHPNICTVYEVEEHEEQPFLVMQLLEGETLRDRLARASTAHTALPFDEALDIALQVLAGLEAAHRKGIIHRDIKPANIFLTNSGQAKILDFGLAKLVSASHELGSDGLHLEPADGGTTRPQPVRPAAVDETITRLGTAMGTAGYMSPEQIRGEKLDPRTDLFSFGLVLYEMFTGQRAFSGETAAIVQDAILNDSPVPVRELNSKLPAKLVSTIGKALEKDRDRRRSAAEMRADLESISHINKPSSRTRWKRIAAALVLSAVAAVAGIVYWRSRNATKLTDTDTIVLADFSNQTSDPVFDDALNTALRVELEQTPFLNVLGPDKVRGTLKQMNHAENETLTPALARDVCLHSNSKAVVQGRISDVGNQYGIELTAQTCQTGKTFARTKLEANERNQIVKTLGVAGNQLREKLGEPKVSLQKFNQPLDVAMSSSLEALQAFAKGRQAFAEKGPFATIPFYRRTVELDSNFARAYATLGVAYADLGEIDHAVQYLTRAYELRDRATRRASLSIESLYHMFVTGDLEKAIQILMVMTQDYPRDNVALNNLSWDLTLLGKYPEAAAQAQEALRLEPNVSTSIENLITADLSMNRLNEAEAVYDAARAHGVETPPLQAMRYLLAFLEYDNVAMAEQLKTAMGKPGFEYQLLGQQGDTEAYYGRIGTARQFSQRAVESASRAGMPEAAVLWVADEAERDAMIGEAERARKGTKEGLQLSRSKVVTPFFGLTLALAGNVALAQSIADKLNEEHPQDTVIQNYWLPSIQAAIELQKNNPIKAIKILEKAIPYEIGNGGGGGNGCLSPIYVRGLAYLQAGQGEQAAAEFQKVIDHPGVVTNTIQGALSHVQLGRAQAMMGDKAAARKSYQDFLTLWKDADPDIPIYRQAKAEYAKVG